MKTKRIYLGFILVLLAIVIYLLALVSQDRGIALGNVVMDENNIPDAWNTIIANETNSNTIKLMVDGVETNIDNHIYMDNDMNIMLPVKKFSSIFKCAINSINDEKIEFQRGNNIVEVYKENAVIVVNGASLTLEAGLKIVGNQYFINTKVLEMGFNYDYRWDSQQNILMLSDTMKDESIIPTKYSYREVGRLPDIKNQGTFGTCWAFASLTAVESSLMPMEKFDFSEDNMALNNGYFSSQNDGGDYTRAIAYLTSWKGPVLEEDDIYGDGEINYNAKTMKHIQEVQIIDSKNIEAIKKAVFLYGGVESSLYTSMNQAGESSMFYNPETASYCYIGVNRPNHDVVIVGWDDKYPKSNFNVELEADGAFICMNSWGTEFGDDGLFYVSYYDSNIGIHNAVYTRVEDTNNYDNIYQSDLCGWIGQLGYDEDTAYFSNVYTAKEDEMIKAVGFYATGKNTSYEIYYLDEFEGVESFSKKRYIQSGMLANKGFYTIDLEDEFQVKSGEKFAVIVKLTTPDTVHPVAIEYRAGTSTSSVVLDDGEGYISLFGKSWEHVEESKACNLCLKVYSTNMAKEG